jgi:hypothetical protein
MHPTWLVCACKTTTKKTYLRAPIVVRPRKNTHLATMLHPTNLTAQKTAMMQTRREMHAYKPSSNESAKSTK